MQRILLIGNAGAGKTTFTKQLAQKLHLPLVHLDKIYWRGNWDHLSRDAFDRVDSESLPVYNRLKSFWRNGNVFLLLSRAE